MGWIGAVRPSRQPLRGFLRMRDSISGINSSPHAEERPRGASRSMHDGKCGRVSTQSEARGALDHASINLGIDEAPSSERYWLSQRSASARTRRPISSIRGTCGRRWSNKSKVPRNAFPANQRMASLCHQCIDHPVRHKGIESLRHAIFRFLHNGCADICPNRPAEIHLCPHDCSGNDEGPENDGDLHSTLQSVDPT